MIGHYQHNRLLIHFVDHFTDQLIHTLIQILDHVSILVHLFPSISGMTIVEAAEEHMLNSIGRVKHACNEPSRRSLNGTENHFLALLVEQPCLLQKSFLIQNSFIQGPRVLSESK